MWITAVLLLLVGLVFLAATTAPVQTWLAHQVASYLSKELKTTVRVDRVQIKPISSVTLKGLYIEDLHHDTLLFMEELSVSLNDISTKNKILDIGELKLVSGGFYLRNYRGEEHANLAFLIDYFSSDKPSDTTSPPYTITIDKLVLENLHFKNEVEEDTLNEFGMDYAHMDVFNIHGTISNIHFINDSIFGNFSGLSARERCGFVLNALDGEAKLSSDEMRIRNLLIRTPNSEIHTDLSFNYDSFPDWEDFVEKMRWSSSFRNSRISFTDIAYFAGESLKGLDRTIRLTGDCKGTVARFRCKNVTLEYGQQTVFKGNLALTGLPNVEETYFDLLADQVTTTRSDLETIPLYPFDSAAHLKIPENYSVLGKVIFKGKFSGFYNDFVAYGNVNTAIGFLSSDINLKFDPKKNRTYYKGHLSTNAFNIGKLLNVPDLGTLSMNADLDGSGTRIETAEARMKGSISVLGYKGYNYSNIMVNGQVSQKLFDGLLEIKEPNLDLTFNGQIDFQEEIPVFDFTADLAYARLDTLNLVSLPGETEISSQFQINYSGNKPDNWEGEIQISNLNYKSGMRLYHVNNISLSSDMQQDYRIININSDFLDGELKGQFEFGTIGEAFGRLLPLYFPALDPNRKVVASNQDFTFDFQLKNTSLITEIFIPSWHFAPVTLVSGTFDCIRNKVECEISSAEIRYKNIRLINQELYLDARDDQVSASLTADRMYYSDSSFIEDPSLKVKTNRNQADFILRIADSLTYTNKGYFDGTFRIESPQRFNLHFQEAAITLDDHIWNLDSTNVLAIDSSSFSFDHFRFNKGGATVGLQGTISKQLNDTLFFETHDFSLSDLNVILKRYQMALGGTLNGSASVSGLYSTPLILADLSVHTMSFNEDTLGDASILSGYDNRRKSIHLSMNVLKNGYKTMYVDGDYSTNKEDNNLDFTIQLNNFYFAPYERFMADIVSNVRGKISSDLKLTGTFSKPSLNGYLEFSKASCRVNYLNTFYALNDKVYVKKNAFEFRDFTIRDMKGNIGVANGEIRHTYFSDFRFNLQLDVTNFEAMNTISSQNDLYYGSAFVTGYAKFTGPLEKIKLDMDIRSEKGTEIFIPLNANSELSMSNYITFIDKRDTLSMIEQRTKVNPSGIQLDLRLEITDEAAIEIIFDEKIGDKIKGVGNANLRLTLDEGGNFNIFGRYDITKGDYLFTLQNIINKHFTIDNGAIFWNGDPLNADIDLTAFYKGGTSTLYKVMPEDSSLKRRLNYEVILKLSNKLMNPTINYEIKVTGLDNATASSVYSRLNSEAELTRQVFGLMLLNQFLPKQSGTQQVEGISAAEGAGASATELLSNQVSNWLSQLSTDVSLGFNYRAGDSYNKEEIELIFSKTLFNDRLTIEGNIGVASDQSTRNVMGDFNAEYSLTNDGRVKLKAFNRSNINNVLDYASPYTQGVGIFYHEQFDTWGELLKRYRKSKKEPDKPGASDKKSGDSSN